MKFFNAVRKNTSIGDGTVRDLVGWLERFINVIFPENGIEYWSGHEFPSSARDIGRRPVPTSGFDPTSVHHVACYVRGGYSEGNIIEASLVLRDGTLFTLAWVKLRSRLLTALNLLPSMAMIESENRLRLRQRITN